MLNEALKDILSSTIKKERFKTMFLDRVEAGQKLAKQLLRHKETRPIVLAIPRGGVVVASEVAAALNCPLDLVIPRKIGAPNNPELAVGAVATESTVIINKTLVESLNISRDYLRQEIEKQLGEIKRRRRKYLGDRSLPHLRDKTVILVDDGLATGYTSLAAVKAVKEENPEKIVLAVPVAPVDALRRLQEEVDELIFLEKPEFFFAVGQFYYDFAQTTDEQVVEIMARHHQGKPR